MPNDEAIDLASGSAQLLEVKASVPRQGATRSTLENDIHAPYAIRDETEDSELAPSAGRSVELARTCHSPGWLLVAS